MGVRSLRGVKPRCSVPETSAPEAGEEMTPGSRVSIPMRWVLDAPLPSEFGGQYLALRFRFYYNPTKEEME